jgi:poly(3-hydroxyalkanoate) depolymerase
VSGQRTTDRCIAVLGQQIRVKVRWGTGVPLVLCNGIGISLNALDPVVEHLDKDTTVVRFDAPGVGGSSDSPVPYGFPYLARVLGQLISKLGIAVPVDVLGFSWGGALAQQFAFENPRRCRRLVLVSTGTGAIMVPGKPAALAKLLVRKRRSDDPETGSGDGLHGGTARVAPPDEHGMASARQTVGDRVGYLYQLAAGSVWTSVFALPLIRQETLIIAGTDDPVVPLANARIMMRLLPHATLHLHDGGHMALITDATELAPVIESFRRSDRGLAR